MPASEILTMGCALSFKLRAFKLRSFKLRAFKLRSFKGCAGGRRAIGDGLVEMAVEAELAVRRSRRLLPYLVILSPATDSAPQLAVYSAPSAHLPPSRFFSTSTDLSFSLDSFPCSKIEKKISEGPRSTRHRVTGRVQVVACYPTS
jgi:hypothetical protein